MTESQNKQILAHLKRGGSITGLAAVERFGCTRLAARVRDLKDAGHAISGRWITTDAGKRFKEYYIAERANG